MSNDFNFDPASADKPEDQASPSDVGGVTEDPKAKGKGKKKKGKEKKAKAKKTKTKAKRKRSSSASDQSGPKIPQFNMYTSMLLISLLCLTVASLLLYLELARYGDFPWWKTDGIG